MIDAHTGNMVKRWEGIAHAEIGEGPGGNEKLDVMNTVQTTIT